MVTHSQNLHDEQSRGFDQTLNRARRQLTDSLHTLFDLDAYPTTR